MTYLNYLQQQHTLQTAKSYMRVIDHFLFHSPNKDQSSYEDVFNYLADHNLRSGRVLAGIKKYFDYLLETGQRNTHPCKSLTISRTPKPVQFQELFTKEELERLLERKSRYKSLEVRNKLIISFLIYQGLTPANLINLRVKDIDLEQGSIYIKATQTISKRTLELKPKQIILLQRYFSEYRTKVLKQDTEALFIGQRGEAYTVCAIGGMLDPLRILFPNRILNAKTIRKSVITNWLNEDNFPVDDVQLMSGQKWLSSTEIYIKPNMEDRREKINQFWAV